LGRIKEKNIRVKQSKKSGIKKKEDRANLNASKLSDFQATPILQ
jgi:hypothetical protein